MSLRAAERRRHPPRVREPPSQARIPPQREIASGATPPRNDKWPVFVRAAQAAKQ